MRYLVPVLLLTLVVIASGCTAPGQNGSPVICTPSEKRCAGNFIEECSVEGTYWVNLGECQYGCNSIQKECNPLLPSSDYSVEFVSWPSWFITESDFDIEWKVNSVAQKEIMHTAIHYGYTSVASPASPSDYPNGTAVLNGTIPARFTAKVKLTQPGKVYMRAHAIIDGRHYWSEEKEIDVRSLSGIDNSIAFVNRPSRVLTNQTIALTWSVSGAQKTTTHTAMHYDTLSRGGTFGFDVTPAVSGYRYTASNYISGNYTVPNTFVADITPTATGKIYARAHAVIDGKNFWTDEIIIDVSDGSI